MIETNYTDKTGTWTVLGKHRIPDPSIINYTRYVCDFCEETQVEADDIICDKCAKMFDDRAGRADHQNCCDW